MKTHPRIDINAELLAGVREVERARAEPDDGGHLTDEDLDCLERLALREGQEGLRRSGECHAIGAALADLDAAEDECNRLRVALAAALVDLDACRAALAPVAEWLSWTPDQPAGEIVSTVTHRHVWLSHREADAVLTAAGGDHDD